VCERKLLFHSCRMYMPDIGYGDDKELIFFAILFMLSILCDVIRDVTCLHLMDVTDWQSDSFGKDWLQLLQRRMNIVNNILINVLGTVDTL